MADLSEADRKAILGKNYVAPDPNLIVVQKPSVFQRLARLFGKR
jgi:hypothetical protein